MTLEGDSANVGAFDRYEALRASRTQVSYHGKAGIEGLVFWSEVHSVMIWDGMKVCGHCPLHIHFYGCWIGLGVVASSCMGREGGTCRCVQRHGDKELQCGCVVLYVESG